MRLRESSLNWCLFSIREGLAHDSNIFRKLVIERERRNRVGSVVAPVFLPMLRGVCVARRSMGWPTPCARPEGVEGTSSPVFCLAVRSQGHAPSFLKGLVMARGRTTTLTVRLTPADRQTLQAWQRSTTIAAGRARRGRILLLVSEGKSIAEIARMVGITRRFVYKWVQRFRAAGVEGLTDLQGRGARRGRPPRALAAPYEGSADRNGVQAG